MRACRAILSAAKTAAPAPAAAAAPAASGSIREETISHLRALEQELQQWPTSSLPNSQYAQYLRQQVKAVETCKDKATLEALHQQARDMLLMQGNLSRQKDIALLLSGERAPPRELVRLAAARCGLSVPDTPDVAEARKAEFAKQQKSWQPELKGELADRYGKKLEERFGPESSSSS